LTPIWPKHQLIFGSGTTAGKYKNLVLWNNRSNYLAKKKNYLGELGPKHALNGEWSHTRTGLPVQWVMAMSTGQQAPQLQAGQ